MKQWICWAFVIPSREAENAQVNILWLWSLDSINKGKNEHDSRSPSIFSNCISSYDFPYWKGTLGFDVFSMVYRMLILSNFRLFSGNQVAAANSVQHVCTYLQCSIINSILLRRQVVSGRNHSTGWFYLGFSFPF